MTSRRLTDRNTFIALFLFVASVYFATFVGVTSSNDGSHYALTRALVDKHSFEISEYLSFTEFQDYSLNGELRFSDRPPGTGFWAAAFYSAGRLLLDPVLLPPSKHDAGQPLLMGIGAATATAGALAVGLFFLLLREHFALRRGASLLAALALAFGSVLWKYGSVLYSHSLSALLVMAALHATLSNLNRSDVSWARWAWLGLLLGSTVLVEYSNAVLIAFVGVFLALPILRNETLDRRLKTFTALGGGALVPIAALLVYNTVNFGGPFELSTFNVDTTIWPQNENFSADFATPLFEGLRGLLVWGGENQGLLLMSPVALLALPGWALLWRRSRRDFVLVGGLFLAMLLLFSKSTTYNAATNDGRYLTPFLSLWFIPLAFWLDRIDLRGAWALLAFGLLFLSVRNVFWHIALSWNYDLDLTQLLPASLHVQNVRYVLGVVFPNAANVWWLWWLYGLLALVVLSTRWLWSQLLALRKN